jgi:hypothetical protein
LNFKISLFQAKFNNLSEADIKDRSKAIQNSVDQYFKIVDRKFNGINFKEGDIKSISNTMGYSVLTSTSTNSLNVLNQESIKQRIGTITFDSCLNLLKTANNLVDTQSIAIRIDQFDPSYQRTSANEFVNYNGLKVKFYQQQLDSKGNTSLVELDSSICNNISLKYNLPIPLPSSSTRLRNLQTDGVLRVPILNIGPELNFYQKMIKLGVDVYNPQSPVYNSRCFSIIDPDTGGDTTLNFRRLNYFRNRVVVCSEGCIYKGIDANNYIICDCQGSNIQATAKFVPAALDKISNFNLDIFNCNQNGFSRVIFN